MRRVEVRVVGLPGLERVVGAALGTASEALPTLRARVRHLQRLGFPPGPAVGRAGRAEFLLQDVYAVAIAFRLIDAYVPPATAVRLVTTWWPELARPLLAASYAEGASRWPEQPRPLDAATILVLRPRALANIGSGDASSGRGSVDQGTIVPRTADAATLAAVVGEPVDGVHPASLVVDVRPLFDALVEALELEPGVDAGWVAAGLEGVHVGGGWSGGGIPDTERRPAVRDERIGGIERFYARAREVLAGAASRAGSDTVTLTDRERAMLAYLRAPTPAEDWKRYSGPDGWPALPPVAATGSGAFLDTMSALLSDIGVGDDDLPGIATGALLVALIPPEIRGSTDGRTPVEAFFRLLPGS